MKKVVFLSFIGIIIAIAGVSWQYQSSNLPSTTEKQVALQENSEPIAKETTISSRLPKMAISSLREGDYPGGELTIEEQLANGSNYKRYIASYQSDGLTINGLLTIPLATQPENGFPAIMFIHGYIPPDIYSTVNSYPTYQAYLARAGFVTYKPDLRGHDESEGEPVSAHYSEKYIIDTLNALAYLKELPEADANRIGYWGHSNGGQIGLRTVLIDQDIKAASFWAGVVGSYESMFETNVENIPFLEQQNPLTQKWGLPSEEAEQWDVVEPYNFLDQISIPIELQHGTADDSVPVELSRELQFALKNAGVDSKLIEYQGDDHNIGQNASRAWQTTIEFFNEHL